MTSVGVVTGIYGGYDQLPKPPAQSIEAEWVCVTDDAAVDGHGVWKVIHEPRPGLPPRLAAKVPKCSPWDYVDPRHDLVVWMDGSCHLKHGYVLEHLLGITQPGVNQFVHPWRHCTYDEAIYSAPLPKYVHLPVAQQLDHYQHRGFPRDFGLWCTGLMVYRAAHPVGVVGNGLYGEMGRFWLAEQVRWTIQDQVSQPYVWWVHAQMPNQLPGALHQNDFVQWAAHADGT